MYSNNNGFGEVTALGVFSTWLGVMNYSENINQVSNDDLKKILDMHTKEIIEAVEKNQNIIIENQNKILKLLEEKGL